MELEDVKRLVEALDHERLEGARDSIRQVHVPQLCTWYFELEDWRKRCALVDLLVDQSDPAMDAVLKDVLRAPGVGDAVELPKAFALGYLDDEMDRFMVYYRDRKALNAAVDAKLEALGSKRVPKAKPTRPPLAPLPSDPNQALWMAATSGRYESVIRLLREGADPNLVRDGEPLLLAALIAGYHKTSLALATEKRIDPNVAVNYMGYRDTTPLMFAAQTGKAKMLDALLNAGANKSAKNGSGRTAADYAKGRNAERLRRLLF
jgi:hypothetical protein